MGILSVEKNNSKYYLKKEIIIFHLGMTYVFFKIMRHITSYAKFQREQEKRWK